MKITAAELTGMLNAHPFTVVHFDAAWDNRRFRVEKRMLNLQARKPGGVACAYIDVDEEQDFVRSLEIRNVPSVAYYRGTALVAALIGADQDIARNLEITISGGTPGPAKR